MREAHARPWPTTARRAAAHGLRPGRTPGRSAAADRDSPVTCSLCSVCGRLLCSALVLMQLVQRVRLLQLVIVLAFLVTKNKKQRACVCHCAGGRGPRNRYRDTRLRHLRILGYCSPCLLGYGSATGLVLLCVLLCTLCVAFHLRTVIALRLVLVLFLFLCFCSPQILRL